MEHKLTTVRVKAGEGDLTEGRFQAHAATFVRTPDAYGDVIAPGAFDATLKEWADSGQVLPVLFGHRFDDPDYNIGGVVEAAEDDHGLKIRGQLDLDSPKAAQVHRLMKAKRIGQMSFAFDTLDAFQAWADEDLTEGDFRLLLKKAWDMANVPEANPKARPDSPLRSTGANSA